MAKFYLIRHGDRQQDGVMVGRASGVHLTADGRRQAKRLATHLARVAISEVFCSPLERAIETVTPLADNHHLPVQVETAFQEVDMGTWTGQREQVVVRFPRWKKFRRSSVDTSIPGGETLAEAQSRIVSAMIRLSERDADARYVVGTHEDLIRLAVCYFIGAPISVYEHITIRTGSVTLLDLDGQGAVLELMDVLPAGDPRLVLR